jgi:hypothetical protein
MAQVTERGYGLPSPHPEIAERYYRLAAHGGNEEAEIELARRLLAGRMLVKPENGANEAIDPLNRALSHGSARAANLLADNYRNGELDQPKDPLLAMKYAFLAIKLSVQADPTTQDGNPFYEIDAGILLAEMAVNGQAVDVNDRALLTPDEIDRLQRFYGTVDPETHKVKIRELDVPLGGCSYPYKKPVWVWDWGRDRAAIPQPRARDALLRQRCPASNALRDVRSRAQGQSAFRRPDQSANPCGAGRNERPVDPSDPALKTPESRIIVWIGLPHHREISMSVSR